MKARNQRTPDTCPACGADVPAGARACPECGSCEETGWAEEARCDGLNLPDQPFDYDDFVAREFHPEKARAPRRHWVWWVAFALMLAALLGFLI